MKVLDELAISLGIRNEEPNIRLAEKIVAKKDKKAVEDLVDLLDHKDKNIQSDALKALYETAERAPELIAPHYKKFLGLLKSKNNRLAWGSMAALDSLTNENQKGIYASLPAITDAMAAGTVITRDHGMKILMKLAAVKKWQTEMLGLLLDNLATAPDNQFPTYAENISTVMDESHSPAFIKILQTRLKDIEGESKARNIRKTLKKLGVKA